jgi:uncharacterized protein (DUF849 family)
MNGGLSVADYAGVPVSPADLAADARAVRDAGADELHVHVRNNDAAESLEPQFVASVVAAIRESVPGMLLGVGTGAWIHPGGRLRQHHIARWSVVPDYASVNLGEDDAIEVVDLLGGLGVGVEAGVWSVADAHRLVNEVSPERVQRVLVEMITEDAIDALTTADEVLAVFSQAGWSRPVLLHGEGRSAWPCLRRAAALGLDSRMGLEDTICLENGVVASDNSSLVRCAHNIMTGNDRAVH